MMKTSSFILQSPSEIHMIWFEQRPENKSLKSLILEINSFFIPKLAHKLVDLRISLAAYFWYLLKPYIQSNAKAATHKKLSELLSKKQILSLLRYLSVPLQWNPKRPYSKILNFESKERVRLNPIFLLAFIRNVAPFNMAFLSAIEVE